MYVPEGYEDFKYIVDFSDNYIVLSDRSSVSGDWQNPVERDVLVVYHVPSIYHFTYKRRFTTSQQFTRVDVDSSIYSRADCPNIVCASFCLGLLIVFCINGLTKFVKRGGIFFGS